MISIRFPPSLHIDMFKANEREDKKNIIYLISSKPGAKRDGVKVDSPFLVLFSSPQRHLYACFETLQHAKRSRLKQTRDSVRRFDLNLSPT